MYEIEDVHFKRQITLSNKKMLDTCDTLICYIDEDSFGSGAKSAMLYTKKRGLKIINLYRKEDQPLYGMTQEEIGAYIKNGFKK